MSFKDCGTIEEKNFCIDQPLVPPPAADCFSQSFAVCEPADVRRTGYTKEGDPLRDAILIMPTEAGCKVILFEDTTADSYGPRGIYQLDCPRIEAQRECPWITTPDCTRS